MARFRKVPAPAVDNSINANCRLSLREAIARGATAIARFCLTRTIAGMLNPRKLIVPYLSTPIDSVGQIRLTVVDPSVSFPGKLHIWFAVP